MKKLVPTIVVLFAIGSLFWAFPPFHIRSLESVRQARTEASFDASEFVSRFWIEELLPAAAKAVAVADVLEVAETDRQQVRGRFGRTVGVSTSYFLFVRGAGDVVSADEDQIELSLSRDSEEVDVVIPLGFVFGNAVRDSTGLLDPSDYPNAQEFNDISAALNSMVETNVMPRLKAIASVGQRIEFAGCAEVSDEEMDLNPLTVVPVYAEAE